jgi:hypothetical protein
MRGQKSAEAVGATSHRREGPNTRSSAPTRSMREADADTGAEMPSRTARTGRGTAGGRDSVRQTRPARDDSGGNEALTLIGQVVRRENLLAAHARVVHNGGAPGVDGMSTT